MDERVLGAVVFLILLAISVVGVFWSSRQAERLDRDRLTRPRPMVRDDGTVVGQQT
jgi:hypothetical protein